jgi:hypothetical protein
MTAEKLPSIETLRKLLRYDPDTGELHWNARTPEMFVRAKIVRPEVICARWNSRLADKRADSISGNGYRQVNACGRCMIAHRVVWALHYGSWPTQTIDHLNGDRGDNRIANLRDCSMSTNAKNMPVRRDNSSGIAGVRRIRSGWVALITADKKHTHLGVFKDKFDAVLARLIAEKKHGFTPRPSIRA